MNIFDALGGKEVVLVASLKGGVGKTTTAYGTAFSFNAPYITNDSGSIMASANVKLYPHTYILDETHEDNFEPDEFFRSSTTVVIDLGGFVDKMHLDIIKKLIALANLIVIPTGECDSWLDAGGMARTALSVKKLNPNILFVTTALKHDEIKNTLKYVKAELAKHFPEYHLTHFRKSKVCKQALKRRCSYEEEFANTFILLQPFFQDFIDEWKNYINTVKEMLKLKKVA